MCRFLVVDGCRRAFMFASAVAPPEQDADGGEEGRPNRDVHGPRGRMQERKDAQGDQPHGPGSVDPPWVAPPSGHDMNSTQTSEQKCRFPAAAPQPRASAQTIGAVSLQ